MTVIEEWWNTMKKYFNSHPHEEDDAGERVVKHNENIFQLTSSRRGWPVLPCTANLASVIFQLTSSRRGWPYQSNRHGEGLVFQLTSSRRGWRLSISFCTSSSPISTHILTKRMTTFVLIFTVTELFQLTSSRRGWHHLTVIAPLHRHFNSHPHEEDDN